MPGRNRKAIRQAIQGLIGVFDVHAAAQAVGDAFVKVLLQLGLDDADHLVKPRADGVVNGIVDQKMILRIHGGNLLQTAIAAAQPGGMITRTGFMLFSFFLSNQKTVWQACAHLPNGFLLHFGKGSGWRLLRFHRNLHDHNLEGLAFLGKEAVRLVRVVGAEHIEIKGLRLKEASLAAETLIVLFYHEGLFHRQVLRQRPLHAGTALQQHLNVDKLPVGSVHAGVFQTSPAIAEACHCSVSTLSHLFRRRVGVSIPVYITKLRIEHAKALLAEAQNSISDIALRVGFNDPAYFSRLFTRYAGMSPKNYRGTLKKK